MTTMPPLDRRWTLAEATEALWAEGISLKLLAGGYSLNFDRGGTPKTEYITDDLIDALMTGFAMAEHPPAAPRIRRRRRISRRSYILRHNGELRKKLRRKRR